MLIHSSYQNCWGAFVAVLGVFCARFPPREASIKFACGANYLAPGWFNFACGVNYPHQAH